MVAITEDYVSFETAKLLKEKGFDDIDCECHGWIGRSGKHYSTDDTFYDDEELKKAQEDRKDFVPLITLQMAMKWLREVHNLVIQIEFIDFLEHGEVWLYSIIERKTIKRLTDRDEDFTEHSYELSCEAAIKYCLENLI